MTDKPLTQQEKIVRLLSDGEFHSNVELCNVAGWRFGGHLFALRRKGYQFEKERKHDGDKNYVEYWKMVIVPDLTK